MNKILKYTLSLLIVFCPIWLYGQEQLVKTALKGTKKLFKVEAKTLTKEGVEASNKTMLKDAFKAGTEEIGKNYMQKASAKQLIRGAVRKNILKEIEEKELGSILRYGMVNAKKEVAHTEKSLVKELAEKEAKNFNYGEKVSNLKNKVVDNCNITTKEAKNSVKDAGHLMSLYCKKGGFKRFMALSMKDRMVTIKLKRSSCDL